MSRRTGGRDLATVLFLDIVQSTTVAAELGDDRWQELLRRYRITVRSQLRRFRGREVDTAGDGFFATFTRPADGVRAATAIAQAVRDLGLEVRTGLHFGEVLSEGRRVSGVAVHTGARVMAHGGPGEVVVTSTVKDLVGGARLDFEDRGTHALRGVPGEWRLFTLTSVDGTPSAPPLDPEKAADRRRSITPRRPQGRRIQVVIGSLVAIAAAVGLILALGNGEPAPTPRQSPGLSGDQLLRLDPDTQTTGAAIPLPASAFGSRFTDVETGQGGVWVDNGRAGSITHVDPAHDDAEATIPLTSAVSLR
jgi:class 3 adenylate cyclase